MAVRTKRGGLGKGLDLLLGTKEDVSAMLSEAKDDVVAEIEISKLQPGKYQPRTFMDKKSLEELAQSIKEQGLISPILVRPISENKYEIIAGERRYQASRLAGLEKVPVLIRRISDEKALAWALIENIQRENLNPLEEAYGIERLINEFKMTHEAAAQAIGRSRTATSNLLRLIHLAKPVQDLLMANEISMGHARALLPLEAGMQVAIANEVVAKGLSVRQVEAMVAKLIETKTKKNETETVKKNADVLRLEEMLSNTIGASVHVSANRKGKGKLVIEFADLEQLDGILSYFGDFR